MVNTTNEKAAGRRAQQLEQDNDALAQHNASLHQRLRAQTAQAEKTEETANTAQTEKTAQRLAHPAREASEDAREEGEGEGEGEGGQGAHATSTAAGNHSGEPEHGARQDCGGETAPGERPDCSGETEQREKLLQLLQLYLLNRHKKRRLERHCSLWSWRRRLLLQRHVCLFLFVAQCLAFRSCRKSVIQRHRTIRLRLYVGIYIVVCMCVCLHPWPRAPQAPRSPAPVALRVHACMNLCFS